MTTNLAGNDLSAVWPDVFATARNYDFDRYLAATLSPRNVRQDLIVLAAFAGEMARIPLTVSDPTIGAVRQQWWRDALLSGGSGKSGNPLADAVIDVVQRHKLPVGLLVGHIDAQELELYGDLVEDLDALKVHFQKRDSALFDLAAMILSDGKSPHASSNRSHDVIQAAGLAYGLSRTLCEVRMRAQGRQLLVPADRARVHGISIESGAPDQQPEALRCLVLELSEAATTALQNLRSMASEINRGLNPALLPAALTEAYLRSAVRQFEAAISLDTRPSPLTKTWCLLRAYWRGSI